MKRVAIAIFATFILISAASVYGADTTGPIKIGYLAHLTGDASVWGIPETNTAKMAAEEINAAGGILGRKIEIVSMDSRSNAADAVNAVKKAVAEQNIVAVLGSNWSGINIATSSVCAEAKIPQISSYATAVKVTMNDDGSVRPWAFRTCFMDPYQGKVIAYYLNKELGKKTAAVLYDIGSDYSTGLTQYFEENFTKLGGKVLGKWAYKAGDVDFRPQLTQILSKKPEVLMIPITYKDISLVVRQARELGMEDTVIMGGDGASPAMLAMAGPELQGSYWVKHVSPEDPIVAGIWKKYDAKYKPSGEYANIYKAYELVYFIADIIKASGTTNGETIRKAIENCKDFKIADGLLTMDPKTHNPLNKSAVILQAVGKELKFVTKYAPID